MNFPATVLLALLSAYAILLILFTAIYREPVSLRDLVYLVLRSSVDIGVAIWHWLIGPARHWISDPPRKRKNDE